MAYRCKRPMAIGLCSDPKHARALAEFLDRADSRAGRAHQIAFENCARGAQQVLRGDFLNEPRNIDMGWAGMCAGRVEAEQTSVGFDNRFLLAETRKLLRQRLFRINHEFRLPLANCV